MRRLVVAAVLFALAGCGAKKPAASPAPPAPPPREAVEVDAGELFTRPLPDGLRARLTRREYTGYREGGAFVIDGGYQYFLTVTNDTASPARVRCPMHLLGTFEKWDNPYRDEARAPEQLYFIVVRDRELRIPAGQEKRVELREAWYIGNANRPPPVAPGTEPELKIAVPPADSPYVRAAQAIEALAPPLDPWFQGLAYSLISDASPDEFQRKRMLAWAWAGLKRLRDALEGAGVRPRLGGLFEEAAKKRDGILEALRAAPDAGAAIRALDDRSCAGDADVALALAAFLKPDPGRRDTTPLPLLLGRLKVRDARVLDGLFEFALRDGDEFSRVRAAIEGAKLGDPRCVPLLVQYSRNPDIADGDVRQLAQECTGVLVELFEAQGKFVRGGSWKEAIDRFGGLDSPDLKGMAPEPFAELKAFLASGKNLRRKVEK